MTDTVIPPTQTRAGSRVRVGRTIGTLAAAAFMLGMTAFAFSYDFQHRDWRANFADPGLDEQLANRLSGSILLQVEQNGESWLLDPVSRGRFFMGRPRHAFALMRNLGLGITNADLSRVPIAAGSAPPLGGVDPHAGAADEQTRNRLAGRILLQVEDNGEAWYVHPQTKERYYMGRPADAFALMRGLGLGIATASLNTIPIHPDSLLPPAAGEGFADDEDAVEDNEQLVEVPEEDVIPERRPEPQPEAEEEAEEPVADPEPEVEEQPQPEVEEQPEPDVDPEPDPEPDPDPEVGPPPIDPFAAPVLSEYAWSHCTDNADRLQPAVADPDVQEIVEVRNLAEFYEVVERIEFGASNLTVRMHPGLYPLESEEQGSVYVYGDNVRIESTTGDWDDVRILGYGQNNANGVPRSGIVVLGEGFVMEGVTIGNVPWNAIVFSGAGDRFHLHNVRVVNGGRGAIYSGRGESAVTQGTVTCSLVDYLEAPATNSFAAIQFFSSASDWLIEGNVLYGARFEEDPEGQKFASAIDVTGNFSDLGEVPDLVERVTVTKNLFLYNETALDSSHGSDLEFSYNGIYADEPDWAIGAYLYGPSFEDNAWMNAQNVDLSHNVVLLDTPDAGAEFGFRVTGSNTVSISRNYLNIDFYTEELPDGPGPTIEGNVISRDLIQDFRDPSIGDFRLVPEI